jgi:hypothetical protein
MLLCLALIIESLVVFVLFTLRRIQHAKPKSKPQHRSKCKPAKCKPAKCKSQPKSIAYSDVPKRLAQQRQAQQRQALQRQAQQRQARERLQESRRRAKRIAREVWLSIRSTPSIDGKTCSTSREFGISSSKAKKGSEKPQAKFAPPSEDEIGDW